MTRFLRWLAPVAMLAALAAPLAAAPQFEVSVDTFDSPSVRVLQDFTLRAGDRARQVVVIGGDAKIEGHVSEDVVVVLGKVQVASTAEIDGNFVSIAGTVEIADGAKVHGDYVVVGDATEAPTFFPGGQHVVIGTAGLTGNLRSIVPWIVHGLVLGRPIVPWLGWVWIVAGICFFLNLCLNLIFDAPVRACATTLRTSPLSAFIAGLLVLLLMGPACVLLAVSVIGIAVIPFFLCAIVVASLLGRVGFARWLGMSIVHQENADDRGESLRSFVIGSALMCVVYMIPFLGIMLWILAGVFGLGSATLAFYSSYRRENPRPPRKAAVVPPPPAPVSVPMAAPAGDAAGSVELQSAEVAAPRDVPAVELAQGFPQFPRATFSERLLGLTIDLIAIGVAAQLLGFDNGGQAGERLIVLLALIYHVSFWTLRGTTLGGIICQLRVVRVDGRKLDFPDALIRGLTGIFSLVFLGLGFLWILRDPEQQAWHDRVAGTYVLKVPRHHPV
jgi:uncharacterized RDD family membrane protein YckC